MVELQISENSSSSASANSSLSSAQTGHADAQNQLNGAIGQEGQAASDKSAKDQNYSATQNNVFSAEGVYTQAENQVFNAQSALAGAVSGYNSAQAVVSTCEGDVASAEAKARAQDNKPWYEKLWDGFTSLIKGLWDAVTNLIKKLDDARRKLQEALGIKVDKEKCLDIAKGVSQEAKDKLNARKQECNKAQELAWAAQTILEAATGAREVSQQELDTAMQIVAQAEAEKERLDAEGQNLQTQKSEIQQKYDELLAQISDVLAGKEVQLQDVLDKINALQSQTNNTSAEIAIEEELEAKLSAMSTELMAKNGAQSGFGDIGNMFGSLFGGGPKGEVEQLEEYKKLLEEAILSGDRNKLNEIYQKMTEGSNKSTVEELKNADSEEKLIAAIAKIPGAENKKMYIDALNSGDQAEIDRVLKLIEGSGLTDDIMQEATMSRMVGSMLTNDTKIDLVQELKKQADALSGGIDDAVGGQGAISWGLGQANNLFGIGTTENMSRAQIAEYQNRVNQLLEDLENGDVENFEARYKSITGETLSLNSISELSEGKDKVSNSTANQSIDKYKDTQENIKNAVVGTVVAIGAVALTAATFGGAAPFLACAAIAGGFAAVGTVGLNAIDGWNVDGSGYTYSWKEAGKDALTGFISGSVGYLSAGFGDKIASSITSRLGGSVIKQTATLTAKEFLIKQGATAAGKFVGETITGAGEGAITNMASYSMDCLFGDKKFNLSEFGTATWQGALAGGTTSGVMSLGTSAISFGTGLYQFNKMAGSFGNMVDVGSEHMQFLQDQVRRGNLDPATLRNVSSTGQITQSMLDDIDLVRYAQENNIPLIDAYVPKYDNYGEFAQASLKAGDVFEYNGNLLITPDGGLNKAMQLDITRQDYFDLFPPMQRFANVQGHIGDCYLLTDITRAYNNPEGKIELLRFFSREGDDIVVNFPGSNMKTTFANGDLSSIPNLGTYTAKGAQGVQMLEVAYGQALKEQNIDVYTKYLRSEIEKFSDQGASARIADMEDLYDSVPQKAALVERATNFYNDPARRATLEELEEQLTSFLEESSKLDFNKIVTFDTMTGAPKLSTMEELAEMVGKDKAYTNAAEYLRGNGGTSADTDKIFGFYSERLDDADFFARYANHNQTYSHWGATKPSGVGFENPIDPSRGIVSSHAYNIIPVGDGTFNLINPHGTAFQTNITLDELKQYFGYFYSTRYS